VLRALLTVSGRREKEEWDGAEGAVENKRDGRGRGEGMEGVDARRRIRGSLA
jgi:hypothetical protein